MVGCKKDSVSYQFGHRKYYEMRRASSVETYLAQIYGLLGILNLNSACVIIIYIMTI